MQHTGVAGKDKRFATALSSRSIWGWTVKTVAWGSSFWAIQMQAHRIGLRGVPWQTRCSGSKAVCSAASAVNVFIAITDNGVAVLCSLNEL